MASINASLRNSQKTLNSSLLALCLIAGALVTTECAEAGSPGRMVLKSATKRLAAKPAARGAVKHKSVATRNRAALQQQHRALDGKTLSRIETRYGAYIEPNRMAQAKASPTAFLSHPRYQQQLKRSYPTKSQHERKDVVGNYVRGRTYVDRNQVLVPRITAHERLHQLANPGFRLRTGSKFDEGTTEFFASKIYSDLRIQNMPVAYPQKKRVVEMMASRVGERNLARAYFGGDVSRLQKQLDGQLGAGSFRNIVRAVENERHHEAMRILRHTR